MAADGDHRNSPQTILKVATANAQPVRNENRVFSGSKQIGVIFPQRSPNPHTGFNSSKTRSTSSSVL
jgi:hypothetical protein